MKKDGRLELPACRPRTHMHTPPMLHRHHCLVRASPLRPAQRVQCVLLKLSVCAARPLGALPCPSLPCLRYIKNPESLRVAALGKEVEASFACLVSYMISIAFVTNAFEFGARIKWR